MLIRTVLLIISWSALTACASHHASSTTTSGTGGGPAGKFLASAAEPLMMGDTFAIESRIMGESRRVNVFVPTVYGQRVDTPLPVLYMPDGGMDEDFLHIAGLMQVLVSNGGIRPFMLVGIPNTVRRRDMTGPTSNAEDRKIAPVVGGSATYRRFIKEELIPAVKSRYRTTDEAAIIGESLAGLFVVETFFLEPDLFSTYIAVDPSLWWADDELLKSADARLLTARLDGKSIFLASSNEPTLARVTAQLAGKFDANRAHGVACRYAPLPAETHATIYHPAALIAFRSVLAPPPVPPAAK